MTRTIVEDLELLSANGRTTEIRAVARGAVDEIERLRSALEELWSYQDTERFQEDFVEEIIGLIGEEDASST